MSQRERFAVLHGLAVSQAARLTAEFDVERTEGYDLDAGLESGAALERATIVLSPRSGGGAPIAVAFSRFPGLHVRFGRWVRRAFPACGCDACDEDPLEEARQFQSLIEEVTAGRFRESVETAPSGARRLKWEFGMAARGMTELSRDEELRAPRAGEGLAHRWPAWLRQSRG